MISVEDIAKNCPCFGITGTRHPSRVPNICYQIAGDLAETGSPVLVGCAPGVDEVFRGVPGAQEFKAVSRKAADLVIRSTQVIKAIAAAGGCLLAFPATGCPAQVAPSRRFEGYGSGSWGSIALAIYYRVPVYVYWPDFVPGMYVPAPYERLEDWLFFKPLPTLL